MVSLSVRNAKWNIKDTNKNTKEKSNNQQNNKVGKISPIYKSPSS